MFGDVSKASSGLHGREGLLILQQLENGGGVETPRTRRSGESAEDTHMIKIPYSSSVTHTPMHLNGSGSSFNE
jgi:hypothetical protein